MRRKNELRGLAGDPSPRRSAFGQQHREMSTDIQPTAQKNISNRNGARTQRRCSQHSIIQGQQCSMRRIKNKESCSHGVRVRAYISGLRYGAPRMGNLLPSSQAAASDNGGQRTNHRAKNVCAQYWQHSPTPATHPRRTPSARSEWGAGRRCGVSGVGNGGRKDDERHGRRNDDDNSRMLRPSPIRRSSVRAAHLGDYHASPPSSCLGARNCAWRSARICANAASAARRHCMG